MAAINSGDKPSWLVGAVSERLSGSTMLLLLHSLFLLASICLTSGNFSCCQSLVLPRLMVRYSWWRQSLGVIFMAPYFPQSIFDIFSCSGTQWIVDEVMVEHFLHSVLICDIHNVRFPLDCSQAAVCPCTLFRVRCRPNSEAVSLNFYHYNLNCLGSDQLAWVWLLLILY